MTYMIWPSGWPSEPSDEEWWKIEARMAAEEDAVPTYDELMEQYENEVTDEYWYRNCKEDSSLRDSSATWNCHTFSRWRDTTPTL